MRLPPILDHVAANLRWNPRHSFFVLATNNTAGSRYRHGAQPVPEEAARRVESGAMVALDVIYGSLLTEILQPVSSCPAPSAFFSLVHFKLRPMVVANYPGRSSRQRTLQRGHAETTFETV